MQEVIPLSLGIETTAGVMTKFIERNTPIPFKTTHRFNLGADYRNKIHIAVSSYNLHLCRILVESNT